MTTPSNSAWAAALVEGLVTGGARHAVLSPGSRHTPIVLALHRLAASGQVTLHDVLDERTAAFFGLGIARMTGQPVLLACTSGSAGSHYLPAMIEASHDRLPLIALTADRPPELHGVGAPQTTTQGHFFTAHVRLQAEAGPPEPGKTTDEMCCLAERALARATGAQPGPVHLNLRFRKPLWDEGDGDVVPTEPTAAARPADAEGALLDAVAETLGAAQRGLLVCGPGDLGLVGRPRQELVADLRVALGRLADRLGWPVLVDGGACLRGGPEVPGAVHVADTLSRIEPVLEGLAPEVVLRVGQIPTSTTLRRWLAHHGAGHTILLDASGERHDPDTHEALVVAGDPITSLKALVERLDAADVARDPTWPRSWSAANEAVMASQAEGLLDGPLWAGSTARVLAQSVPGGGILHLASSLAIRAFDAFGGATASGVQVTSNRGVNGIDGTLATAFGQAATWDGPVAVMLGDLAFLHDLGSLATLGARRDSPPMVLVVLDNGGGGIFDHLPIADHPTAHESRFVTPPQANIAGLGAALASAAESITEPDALRRALQDAFNRPGVTVLHVPFSRAYDLERHGHTWAIGAAAADEEVR